MDQDLITCDRIRPMEDRILVRRAKESDKIIGGIILPATASKVPPSRGVVLEVGNLVNDCCYIERGLDTGRYAPEEMPDYPDIEKGTIVLFNKYAGVEFTADDPDHGREELLIMKRDEIYCVVRPLEEEPECPSRDEPASTAPAPASDPSTTGES